MGEQEVGASEEIVRSDFVGHQMLPHREQPACWALSFRSADGRCVDRVFCAWWHRAFWKWVLSEIGRHVSRMHLGSAQLVR